MALATVAATIAGTTTVAAYLNARFHIAKDIDTIRLLRHGEREYVENVKKNRLSCFYFFEEAVHSHPDHLAIWSRAGSYTDREVHQRACQYAMFFLDLGVKPGDLVAFYLQNSPDFMFAWLGLWAIGCAPAMINFNLASNPLVHCLRVSGARILLVDEDEKCRNRIENEKEKIEKELGMQPIMLDSTMVAEIRAKPAQRPADSYRAGVTASFPAALIYTSGTTGLPKGAPFTTSRLHMSAAQRSWICKQRRGPGGDRWYNCMPFYHGTGGQSAMANLMSGVSLAIGKGFSTRSFWKDVRDSESTFIVYVGETARYLLAAPIHPLDKVHKVRCMFGNGLRPDVWLRFRERFAVPEVAEFFNSSEGVLSLFIWNRGDYSVNCVGHHGGLLRYTLRNVFVPVEVDHQTNEIVRDTQTGFAKRNSYEEGGEIIVQVPEEAVFAGYWNDPQATKKKFARDVFKKGDLYYRSGDALRRTPDGRWYFQDRLGDTYRWKSENVSTAEVAEVMGHFSGVLEANVYGVQIPGHEGRAGCAALSIAPEKRKEFDWKSLAQHATKNLPKYAVPVFIRVVAEEVGGTASHNNKQDKASLREEGVDPKMRGTKVAKGREDELLWMPPKGEQYVMFRDQDWKGLVGGTARL